MGRQDKLTAPGGTITSTTFDCRNNPTEVRVGTSAGNMVLVTEREYEGSGGDCACSGGLTSGLLSTLTQHVDASTTRVAEFKYDWRNRQEYKIDPADADNRVMYAKNYYDNLDRAWKVERYYDADGDEAFPGDGTVDDGDRLLACKIIYHDELNRPYKTERYAVDPDDGTVGNALTGNIWYDAAGKKIKEKPAGSDSFTKTSYDGVGQPVKQYVGYDTDETLYADADDVTGDTIFEQTETTYNPQGNKTWIVSRSRLHDATGTGELTTPGGSQPKARVSYTGTWYDQIRRPIATANYGTNGGTAPTRPNTAPASSDTVLVSTVEYDTSTGDAYKTVDPKGREDRQEFDDAGRVTKTIQNYTDGNPATGDADEDVTVETVYTIDGEVSTQTAKNSTTNDQVTQYIYGTSVGGISPEIYRKDLLRAVISPDSDDPATLDGNGADGVYDRVEHKYNRQSERIETKDQNGTIREFEYDKLGRRTTDKAITLGTDVDNAVRRAERDYEVRGMLAKATNYDAATGGFTVNEVELAYDDFGKLIADHQEHDGTVNQDTLQVQYAHANGANNHARLTSIIYPNGRVLHHEHSTGADSNLSRLSYLSDVDANGQRLAEYTYLGLGQIVKVDYSQPDLRYNLAHGAGDDPYDGLDRFGRVVDLLWRDYGSSADAVRIKHGYDRAGNRLWREDAVSKSQGTPVYLDELYTYDGMYQLATLQRGELNANKNGLVAESKTFAEQWTLDPTGNWTNFKQDPDGDGDWDLDQNRTHNKANEIATIAGASTHVAHDRAGNMIRSPKPADWSSHYHLEYDAWNRLMTVYDADGTTLVAGYNYDALGRRTEKETYSSGSLTEIRHFYYSNQWQVLEEHVQGCYYSGGSSSCGVATLDRQFVWGQRYIDDLICRDRDADSDSQTGNLGKTGSGLEERLYAMQDPNWNVVAIANTSGAIQERYRYDAYGKPSFLTSAFVVRDPNVSSYSWTDLFTGRQYDAETGFYHYRQRPLGAGLGRFLGRDPLDYDADYDPYRYVRNDPANMVDPEGLRIVRCATLTPAGPFSSSTITWHWVPDTYKADPCKCLTNSPLSKAVTIHPDLAKVIGFCGGNIVCEKELVRLLNVVEKMPEYLNFDRNGNVTSAKPTAGWNTCLRYGQLCASNILDEQMGKGNGFTIIEAGGHALDTKGGNAGWSPIHFVVRVTINIDGTKHVVYIDQGALGGRDHFFFDLPPGWKLLPGLDPKTSDSK